MTNIRTPDRPQRPWAEPGSETLGRLVVYAAVVVGLVVFLAEPVLAAAFGLGAASELAFSRLLGRRSESASTRVRGTDGK